MGSLQLLSAVGFALGWWLLWSAWQQRKLRLQRRLAPYLKEITPAARGPRVHRVAALLRPVWEQLGSTQESVGTRLSEVGVNANVERFRLWQFICALLGALAMGVVGALLGSNYRLTLLVWMVLLVVGFCLGAVALDRLLTLWVRRENQVISQQVADTAQLLALSISAGESIPAALARVSRVCGPQLARQLREVVEAVDSGVALTRALAALAQRTHSTQLARLLDTLVTASERGAPLAMVLREQARDLRDESRRNLLESGGRREIAMMVPVVFVILPITILFALYPGLVALRL